MLVTRYVTFAHIIKKLNNNKHYHCTLLHPCYTISSCVICSTSCIINHSQVILWTALWGARACHFQTRCCAICVKVHMSSLHSFWYSTCMTNLTWTCSPSKLAPQWCESANHRTRSRTHGNKPPRNDWSNNGPNAIEKIVVKQVIMAFIEVAPPPRSTCRIL